jgi:hypothetical protein
MWLSGCGSIGKYKVNESLLEESRLFNTSQLPDFYLKLEENLEYLGEVNYSRHDSGLSITTYGHYFYNKVDRYDVRVFFASMNTGEWHPYEPWRWKQPNEMKGKTEYLCGLRRFTLKMNPKEREIFEPFGIEDGQTMSQKIWVNKYSGLRTGTRVIVCYTEEGNQVSDTFSFMARANKRANFFQGSAPENN